MKKSPQKPGPMKLILASLLAAFAAQGAAQTSASASYEMPKSHNPLKAYLPNGVPEPQLTNSPRLGELVRDGKLHLSLKHAIPLPLDNTLALPIPPYNFPLPTSHP